MAEYHLENISGTPNGALVAEANFPPSSTWFDGHFEEGPILPGVAQIWLVAEQLRETLAAGERIGGFKRVRFKHLLKPNERLRVSVSPGRDPGSRQFRIEVGTVLACSGIVLIQNRESPRKPYS